MSPPRENRPVGGAALAKQPGGPRPTLPDPRDEAAHHTDGPAWPAPVGDFAWVIVDEDEPPPVRVHRLQLPLRFEDLTRDLLATVGALARLAVDDRFPKHRHKVVARNLADLNRAAAELHDLLDDLRWSTRWSS